jgi:hypothetical protein
MKQVWPENKIVANSLALTKSVFYVYKLTLMEHGHYYIGCTADLSTRLKQHLSSIIDAKHNDIGNFLPFHHTAADLLCDHIDSIGFTTRPVYLKRQVIMHLMAFADNRKYALALESMIIKDCISDPLCLNSKR